jgi:hypothetical protein
VMLRRRPTQMSRPPARCVRYNRAAARQGTRDELTGDLSVPCSRTESQRCGRWTCPRMAWAAANMKSLKIVRMATPYGVHGGGGSHEAGSLYSAPRQIAGRQTEEIR